MALLRKLVPGYISWAAINSICPRYLLSSESIRSDKTRRHHFHHHHYHKTCRKICWMLLVSIRLRIDKKNIIKVKNIICQKKIYARSFYFLWESQWKSIFYQMGAKHSFICNVMKTFFRWETGKTDPYNIAHITKY